MSETRRWGTFIAGSVLGGLAIAALLAWWRPEILGARTKPGESENASPANAASAATDPPHKVPGARDAAVPAGTPTAAPSSAGAGTGAAAFTPTSYAPAVERASPAVVNIYTARVVTERVPRSTFEELFGEVAPRYRQRVERALGSGVVLDAAGHIVTNHHVVADADSIRIQLADGRVAEARVVGRDPDTDLAVLKVDLRDLPVMPLGRSDQLRVGDVVLAIGNPVGLQQTVTQGIVSATGRGQLGVATFENFIQTDAPINFGNSGGALVNTRGDLVGINTAVLARNVGIEGIGFAIPVNLVRGVVEEILRNGRVIRGWIGVIPEDIDDTQARELGLARGGVLVTNLYLGSPALRAGLRPGDLILTVNGAPVTSAQDALTRIARMRPGAEAVLGLQRGRETTEVKIVVAERPRPSRSTRGGT